MRYKAILIDADDTLFDFKQAERLAIEETLSELGFRDPNAAEAYHHINEACWKEFERGELTQDQLKIRRFRELLDQYGIESDAQVASDAYVSALAAKPHLLPGALEAVEEIARHRPVALVTNGIGAVQRGRLSRSPIAPLIRAVLISEEVGQPKPHSAIFLRALELLGVSDPESALMIGDSLSSDMAGAAALHIGTCWYNPCGLAPPEHIAFDHIAARISDFPKYALM